MGTATINTASKVDNNGDKIINKLTHRITTTPIIEDNNPRTKTRKEIGERIKTKPDKPITISNKNMGYPTISDEFRELDPMVTVSTSLEH